MADALFIVFEGVDGCGKSTQARALARQLGALATFEPGATPLGVVVREQLLHGDDVSARSEALLMAADRAQHVATVVRPTLAAGRHVVSDRYLGSSVAYQGHGRELGHDEVEHLSLWATENLLPDLVVWIDVPRDIVRRRMVATPDRFEREPTEFWERVVEGFREQLRRDPSRWVRVDGAGSIEEVADRVRSTVEERLGVTW